MIRIAGPEPDVKLVGEDVWFFKPTSEIRIRAHGGRESLWICLNR
jgi:hypothetical protein